MFPVTLSERATGVTTVRYELAAGSASGGTARTAGADFDPKGGRVRTLTYKAGTVAKVVGVTVFPDTATEGDETFTIRLSNPSAGWSLGRDLGTGTVVDDDATPKGGVQIGIGDAAIAEGDTTKRALKFAVTLSAPATSEVRVGYRIVDGTADCGPTKNGVGVNPATDCDDRKGATRTLRFPVRSVGTTAVKKAVAVTVLPDTVDVDDERFVVQLSDPAGATVPDATGTGTILDDDAAVEETATVLTSDVNPAVEGALVTLTATVTAGVGTPSGTVGFFDGETQLGSAALSDGVATLPTDSLPAGVRTLTASYGGDADFLPSVSDPLAQTIDPPLGPPVDVVGLASGDAHSCALLDSGTVKCWGNNSFGALGQGDTRPYGRAPGELGDNLPAIDLGTGRTATQLSGGNGYTCARLDDGSVKCWGANPYGALGQGDSEDRGDEPGEMGDALPGIDLGTGRTAVAVAAGGQHACALLDDGTVKCWGEGSEGQLGQGDSEHLGDGPGEMGDALLPIDLGTGRTATAIDAGGWHTCAVLDDGSVRCWGWNPHGELGLGDTEFRGDDPGEMGDALPEVGLGAGRTATSIGLGREHSCATLDDGSVKCWGWNMFGQLGQGSTASIGDGPGEMGDALPAVGLGAGRTASAVGAGAFGTCVLLDGATVKCWGEASLGRLGLEYDAGNLGDGPGEMGDALPEIRFGTGRTATALGVGGGHTCVLRDDAAIVCWGSGVHGALGRGDWTDIGDEPGEMGDDLRPVRVGTVGTRREVVQVDAGDLHTCALLSGGAVKCWGANGDGQLGQGDMLARGAGPGEMGADLLPVDLGSGRTAAQIAAGGYFTCALLDDGTVKCWGGANHSGALGQGDTFSRGDDPGELGDSLPAIDLGTGRTATQIAAGAAHACAVIDDGSVKCWGNNGFGQLGLGDVAARGAGPGEMGDALLPVDLGSGHTATQVAAGGYHTCALLDDGDVKCWGDNSFGRLGQGDTVQRGDEPGEMGDGLTAIDLGIGRTATQVVAGLGHTCALLDDGTVKCWGYNGYGQLGRGDDAPGGDEPGELGEELPPVDLGSGHTATQVAAGGYHTCALLDDGDVKCWGYNVFGQLGQGDTAPRGEGPGEMGDDLPPVDLGAGPTSVQVATGGYHGCAVLGDGALKCWGWNGAGQLGQGDLSARGDGPGEMGDDLPTVDLGP